MSSKRADAPAAVLPFVQYLRAVAAAMVVAAHASAYVERWLPVAIKNVFVGLGALGVAVFFIISGFIMYFTCRNDWPGSARVSGFFVRRRLHRIVPLYWLMTTISLAIPLLGLLLGGGKAVALRDAILSYLFIPYDFNGAKFRPVLGVGWTLDYEMFFYLLFALGLLLPKRIGLPAIPILLIGLVGIGQTGIFGHGPLGALAQPIILLFGIGIAMGWLRDKMAWRLSGKAGAVWLALLCLILSPLILALFPLLGSALHFNPWLWAVAAMMAAAAIWAEPGAGPRSAAGDFGLRLGDASYFLYLSHPILILCVTIVAKRLDLLETPVAAFTLSFAAFASSITVSLIGHRLIERPMSRVVAPLFLPRRGRGSVSGAAA